MAILGIYVRFLECILHNFWGRNFISANGKPWLNSWSTNSWNILSNSKSKHGSSKFYLYLKFTNQKDVIIHQPQIGVCLPYVWRTSHYISWYKPVQNDIKMTCEIRVIMFLLFPCQVMSPSFAVIECPWSTVITSTYELWLDPVSDKPLLPSEKKHRLGKFP